MNVTINGKPVSFKATMLKAQQSAKLGVNAADTFFKANKTDVVGNAAVATKATINTCRAAINALASTVKK
jgi:hypothetical protein